MWCFKKISTNNSKDKGIVVLFIVVLIGGIFYTILPNFGIISLIILSSQMKKAKEKKEKNIGEKL